MAYNLQQQFIINDNYSERMDTFADRFNYYLKTSGKTVTKVVRALNEYTNTLPPMYRFSTSYATVMAHKHGKYQPNAARLAAYAQITGQSQAWLAGYGTREIRAYR